MICDRYRDSTLAYQGYGRGVNIKTLDQLNDFATGSLLPDMTILLDVSADVGLARRAEDGSWNRLDADAVEFHRRVQAGYLELARMDPKRWRVIRADEPAEMVQEKLLKIVLETLAARAF